MMHSSGMRNPFSHVCTGGSNYTVIHSICISSGGTPGLCWWNPIVPGNSGLKYCARLSIYVAYYYTMHVSLCYHMFFKIRCLQI